ncbi:nuclear mitotic apparatus protein 1-like isoform X2 [Puntigrus tetrazona]|uniref:nuclear mitotic apparatus protein 1-like isoform X2 n=1 Tax=Puntigrus tetrazona TaxID=1606681 RepID=UPI001C8921CA|nr:nuclear mitotic apparatus protein 1-like isoform X2 [Puntigrus tetrazona]
MQLNEVKEAALLSWICGVYPEEPFTRIIQMMDGHRLLKFAYRVRGKDLRDGLPLSPFPAVMEAIFSMLRADFRFSPGQAELMLQKISEGVELELQLAKVVLVLCYCGFKTYNMVPLDIKTGLMIASMFHFVEDDADGLSLDEGLDRFLTKACLLIFVLSRSLAVMTFSTSSSESSCCSPSYTDEESPIFSRVQNPPRDQFQKHFTVTRGSVSSPVRDVLSTPRLLKRLRRVLAREGDVMEELEKELANQISIISEKEGVISQLQHRVERMLREQGELEKDHKAALLELQEKNERVVKQCQDLKTENAQKKKMIDALTKENQTFAAQALIKTESFQTRMLDLSEQISLKDDEITNLSNKYNSVDHELKLVKEKNIALKEVIKSNCQEHEDTVKKLQQELDSASSVASERREEMLVLSAEVKSLKEQIWHYGENQMHKEELSVLEAKHNGLKEKLTSLHKQLAEVKESELKRELWHQTVLKDKAQELERAVKEHYTEISVLASERDAQINSLKADMKRQQLRSERLRAQLELKVEKQNGSVLALKNVARRWEQQNKELLEKLKTTFAQLQHYSGKNKEAWDTNRSLVNSLQASRREVGDLQMERDRAKAEVKSLEARVDFAKRQERRKMADDTPEVRRGGTQQDTSDDSFGSELNDSFGADAHDVSGAGEEDEPERAADDWMRIAELQARNKACLPHLKSSYPLESGPTVGLPSFTLTDEDLRMGDPKETIRRAASRLHESHTPHALRQPGSLLRDLNTPEQCTGTDDAKMLASCVSRTVTLKSERAKRLSKAEPKRRQSVMFTICNTPRPQRGSLLQRGLKRRKEACGSPAVGSRVLRPAMSAANSRSPLLLRERPHSKSTKRVVSFSSRIICGQNLDLFVSILFEFVCLLFTL